MLWDVYKLDTVTGKQLDPIQVEAEKAFWDELTYKCIPIGQEKEDKQHNIIQFI